MREKVATLESQLSEGGGSTGMEMPSQTPAAGMEGMGGMGKKMGMMGGMGMMNMGDGSNGSSGGMDMGGGSSNGTGGMGMGGMGMGGMGMGGMGMMQMDKMKMAGMMGMKPMMGGMQGMGGSSPLPGFPGASHLYHLGSTGFFLDHGSHISLTTEQTAALNQIREQSALAASASERSIEKAEEELWQLTSSDQPDISAIQSKVEEISKLEAEKRIAFIRAVGEAAKLLSEDQRKSLTGFAPPAPAMEGM
ncbi:Spy/CpxP family protein refolding chaperone [Haloferula sargassicola]|uniref:Spy/CpxP family protein refolding chaperone n=1 Tax=Haloferula sargassicola TaxID=490096 RepID=UPI0033654C38